MKIKKSSFSLVLKLCLLLTIAQIFNVFCITVFAVQETHKKITLVVSKEVGLPRPDWEWPSMIGHRLVLRAFKEKYPWIEVVQSGGIRIEGVSADVGPLMAIAGGVSPDILSVSFRKSDGYIQNGFLYPLDEFVERMSNEELNDRVLPASKPVIYREGSDGKKHWWAFPYLNNTIALVYRKDLFLEAGLDPDKPPDTWEEYLEYSRKITNPDKGIYGTQFLAGTEASWDFYSLLVSAGGKSVEQNEKGEWRPVFNTPEAVEAVYFYTRLIQEPFTKNGKTINGAAFYDVNPWAKFWGSNAVGIARTYLDDNIISRWRADVYGIAQVPKGPTGIRHSEFNSQLMGIYSGVKDPEIRDAAWKFIHFWGSPEADKIRFKVWVNAGMGQALSPKKLRQFGYTEYLNRTPKGWEEAYNEAFKNSVPEPYGKNCNTIYKYMSKPLELALIEKLGTKSPEVAKKRIKELLDQAVAETNEKMIGIIPPKKMAFRRRVALASAVVILITFIFAFIYILKVFTPEGAKTGWGFRKYWIAYLLLIPAIFGMALWQYIPTLRGVIIAFMDYRILGGSKIVGLDNFANVLFDKVFWESLWHSIYFAGLTLGLGFFAPIILAIMLHEIPKGKIFFRIVFYLPTVVSGLVVIFLWKSFYDPSAAGLLNKFLFILSEGKILPQKWLTDPHLAMLCVVVPIVWASMGPGCLIYLAALKTVPDELYEAADIDGSNTWHKLWNVTIPTIKPLIIISFVGAFVGAFKSADFILAMTGGGPAGATTVLGLEIFYNAFLYLRFGTATAMSWLLGFILIGFTVYQLKRLTRMQFKTAD